MDCTLELKVIQDMRNSLVSRFVFVFVVFLLLTSFGIGASIQIHQKHIFSGEPFTVIFVDVGPVNYEAQLKFAGQEKRFWVEAGKNENFTKEVQFTAPGKPGNYTLEYPGGKLVVPVEEPIVVVEDFRIDGETKKGAAFRIIYRIRNPSMFSAINVTRRLDIIPGDGYDYESKRRLVGILNPGGDVVDYIRVYAGENATDAKAILEISYVYDGEKHTIYKELDIKYGGFTWWVVFLVVAIVGVLVYVLWLRKKKS